MAKHPLGRTYLALRNMLVRLCAENYLACRQSRGRRDAFKPLDARRGQLERMEHNGVGESSWCRYGRRLAQSVDRHDPR
jgi:hypothetical protein